METTTAEQALEALVAPIARTYGASRRVIKPTHSTQVGNSAAVSMTVSWTATVDAASYETRRTYWLVPRGKNCLFLFADVRADEADRFGPDFDFIIKSISVK